MVILIKKIVLTIILLTTITNFLFASVATTSGTTLIQPAGAISTSMAEAYSTKADDIFSIHYNPALELNSKQVALAYQTGVVEDSLGIIGFGLPFKKGFFGKSGSFGATILYYTAGNIELIDSVGNESTLNAQTDYLGIFALGLDISKDLVGGASFKFLSSKLINEFSASAFMVDLGCKYWLSDFVKVGASYQNMGSGIKYIEVTEKLPQLARAGVSYTNNNLLAALDIVKLASENKVKEQVGVEYTLHKVLALRAGYKIGYDTANISTGLGFTHKKFSIDYAFVPYTDLGNTHRISVTSRF